MQLSEELRSLSDIAGSQNWLQVKKINKGWSSDQKYLITANDGEQLLLRISDISQHDQKKKEYEMIVKFSSLGFPMSFPRAFGICNEGKSIYMLLTWVEGVDLESALTELSEEEQYRLGRKAGEILKKIHSISVPEAELPKETKRPKKLRQLERYEQSGVRIAGDEAVIRYVKENLGKLWVEPPVYLHGDFHPGNLILMPDGEIGVIDFNRWEIGDPYEEFYKLESFGVEVSVPYCVGQIEAYFEDHIPMKFWEALAVYVAHASLYSIKWAEKFGQSDIDGMVRRCLAAFDHYDEFRQVVPKWYKLR